MTDSKFVSRGGTKLEHALNTFGVDVKDKVVLDVGSSTGGFVDCLLQHGASKIYSLDTAYGELAWTLRKDPRVVVMERTNILDLKDNPDPSTSLKTSLPEPTDLITIDVTFTSLTKILPIVKKFLKPGGKIIALLKPQYEDQKLALKNHGIISEASQKEIVDRITNLITEHGFEISNQADSPILGGSGNKEQLLLISTK